MLTIITCCSTLTWGLCGLWGVRRETEIEKQKAQPRAAPRGTTRQRTAHRAPPLRGYSCGHVTREATAPRAKQTRPCLRPWASSLSLCFSLLIASSSRVTRDLHRHFVLCRLPNARDILPRIERDRNNGCSRARVCFVGLRTPRTHNYHGCCPQRCHE